MSWKRKLPLSETSGENALRAILEELKPKFNLTYYSQGGCDFHVWDFAVQVDGAFHDEPTVQKHDRFWEGKAVEAGYFPIRFKEKWIKRRPELVKQILDCYLELDKTIG